MAAESWKDEMAKKKKKADPPCSLPSFLERGEARCTSGDLLGSDPLGRNWVRPTSGPQLQGGLGGSTPPGQWHGVLSGVGAKVLMPLGVSSLASSDSGPTADPQGPHKRWSFPSLLHSEGIEVMTPRDAQRTRKTLPLPFRVSASGCWGHIHSLASLGLHSPVHKGTAGQLGFSSLSRSESS
jgi:hypothetical protein